jgi:hypothetical protein
MCTLVGKIQVAGISDSTAFYGMCRMLSGSMLCFCHMGGNRVDKVNLIPQISEPTGVDPGGTAHIIDDCRRRSQITLDDFL